MDSATRISRWRLRWIRRRNAILSSPRFQRFAARFPLTRPIARARARTLFDLVAGFTYSQVLAACIEVGLLNVLAAGPRSVGELAAACDLPADAAERLVRAAAALDLAEATPAGWMLGSLGAALLGNRGIAEMVAHHRLLYADLADPVALLRRGGGGGALSGLWRYAESPGSGGADAVSDYSALMAASQPLIADAVLRAYPFHRHSSLLDVGGGEGAFVGSVGARVPTLKLGLFDLPPVGDRARLRCADLAERLTIHRGNFLSDPLPKGYDAISLIRVLHDHDDVPALTLLRAIREALPPGGRIVIAEPMAGTQGAEPSGDAYFGFYLLAMGSGRPRTAQEIVAMLGSSGFFRPRIHPTDIPLTVRVVSAERR